MCAESHKISSGFGRYTQEVMSRLYNSGKYELAELSCYEHGTSNSDVPWKVYPNAVPDNDAEAPQYKSNPINQFGQWRFDKTVLHFKPDIVFDIRDYWMFAYQEMSPLKSYFNWVVAPTIDSIPQQTEWLTTFQNADIVLTHTDWAGHYLKNQNRRMNIGPCVADSVDSETFRPMDVSKPYHKTNYGINPESIIIGSVMRNQKRKLIPALFETLRDLIDETNNPNIYLYLHTSYPESTGWNLPELLQEYNVYNNVLFTYYCAEKDIVSASLFRGAKIPCPNNPGFWSTFPSVVKGLSNKKLCEIYNLFDVYVQYAICEGLGIPQLEAASCGIPIMATNYSGMEEITTKVDGVKINLMLSKELETGSDRAIPDNKHLISELKNWISLDYMQKRKLSKRTRNLLIEHYSWNKTVENLMAVFDSLNNKNLWDKPLETNNTIPVPDNLSNRDFITFIIENIVKEPRLLKTHFAQSLVRGLDESFLTNGSTMQQINRHDAVKNLEAFMFNKQFCEKVRNGEIKLSDKFLDYK